MSKGKIMSALIVGALAASAAAAKELTVTIENMQFAPASLVVDKGDRITWVNKDLVPHTVTAKDGSFDSKVIDPGKSWSRKFKRKGSVPYKCNLHPTMNANMEVK